MISEKEWWMSWWKGFVCLSEKDLDVSAEAMTVDFNEGKAELIEMCLVSVKWKQRKL